MAKKWIKNVAVILGLVFLVISNFTYLNVYLPQCYPYRFCADKCMFYTIERGKGHDPLGSVEIAFEAYKEETGKKDILLHRRFYRKWWQVWNWYDFLTHRRWSYPYAERDGDT